jgi:hypothetical protein
MAPCTRKLSNFGAKRNNENNLLKSQTNQHPPYFRSPLQIRGGREYSAFAKNILDTTTLGCQPTPARAQKTI